MADRAGTAGGANSHMSAAVTGLSPLHRQSQRKKDVSATTSASTVNGHASHAAPRYDSKYVIMSSVLEQHLCCSKRYVDMFARCYDGQYS